LPRSCEPRGKEIIQQWRDTLSSASDAVQADLHGLLDKFGLEPLELLQEENVEVSELFRWIHAYVTMAESGADFKCELSATVAAQTLSTEICGLLPVEGSSLTGILKAQLRLLRDSSFEWPSLDSLRPDALLVLPKNTTKNLASYFHEKGRGLVGLELERMKDQVTHRHFRDYLFPLRYVFDLSFLFQIQAKVEAFARASLGDADAGNLRDEAPSGAGGKTPGRDESGAPRNHSDGAAETGEV
jgi:hypothetical protein